MFGVLVVRRFVDRIEKEKRRRLVIGNMRPIRICIVTKRGEI